MANLAIRAERAPQKSPTTDSNVAWSPAQLMRDLLSWDPFREMETSALMELPAFLPRFEVMEDKNNYLFKSDMPGIKESDLNISLTGNRLVIAGKRESTQQEQGTTYYVAERSYGTFRRSFTLPDSVDTEHIHAELKDGVLTIAIPKKPGAQTKQVPLSSGKPKA